MTDTPAQPTPAMQVTHERSIVPPKHSVALTDRTKSDCELVGLDLIDDIVQQLSPIKDSKGADISDKARTQLQQAWCETFAYALNHQRANARTHARPEMRAAGDSLELIARLRDSKDTMSAMMGRKGIQRDSWSAARNTLHTEVLNRYDGIIDQLVHTVWGHHAAPVRDSGRSPG